MAKPRRHLYISCDPDCHNLCLLSLMMMEEVALEEGVVVEEEVHPSGGVVPNDHLRGVAWVVHKEKTLGVGVEQIQVPDSARVGGQDFAKEVEGEHQMLVGVEVEVHVPQVPGVDMVQVHLKEEGVVDHPADGDEEDPSVVHQEEAADQVLPMVEHYCH